MARRKHYKNETILKLLVVLAGVLALVTQLFALLNYAYIPTIIYPTWYGGYRIIYLIIGLIISVFIILCGLRKESSGGGGIVPFHWVTFLIFAILVVVFGGGLLPCLLLVIAFLIALIEDL
ncbi:MAG: hypothetical protein EU544_02795 [Promethearchaeota archaeon]|nr:MAG: hypothetical protein EU544_02795 [Candidatus Lokiarchaeota archaeon]